MNTLPRVLVIDDEPIIRMTLEGLLYSEEMELLFAENGTEGVRLATEHKPDAILLDIMMPGMDGYETCRRIRANPELAEIHIIMITALDDREARLAGLQAGADDFLTKPFDGVEIQIRVKNILRINRYRNLIAARSRFHWVVEHAEKGYLLLDKEGSIQYANQTAQRYLHLPANYAKINLAQHAARYYQFHFQDDIQRHIPKAKVGYFVQPESLAARAFWLRVESPDSPSNTDDQQLICLTDVTDEILVDQDIRRFHLIVSHKLRTPVALISGAIEILNISIDLLPDNPDNDIKSTIQIAAQGAQRLSDEVTDIMRYVGASVALTASAPASIAEVCRIARTVATELNLQHTSTVRPEALTAQRIGISSSAMDIIIHEILENSRRFHPTHTPTLETIIEPVRAGQIQLCFCDNGEYMTAEQISHAMQPYLQGEKWFTGEAPGMGLGIPLIASLVWQSGGKIRIANHPDHPGVCVVLELPTLDTSQIEQVHARWGEQ